MRFLCEIFVVVALIYLGWQKSFDQRIKEMRGIKAETVKSPAAQIPIAAVTATPDGTWRMDPNRQSILDTPPPKLNAAKPQPSATKSGSWMWERSKLDPAKKPSPP